MIKNGLNNIQNINDNQYFKRCFVRYLHPADHNPTRIRKVDKYFPREFDFKGIILYVKFRDIYQFEERSTFNIKQKFNTPFKKKNIKNTIFGYENKENFPVNVSKSTFKTRVDLL